MKQFLIQWKMELLKLFARKRTYVGFAGFLGAEFIILLMWQLPPSRRAFNKMLSHQFAGMGLSFDDYFQGLTMSVVMVIFTFLFLGGPYLALVSGDIVAKEVEDGTMRMVLSRPISRLRLLWLKWLAISTYTFTLVFFIGITSLLMATLFCGGIGKLAVLYPHPRFPVFAFYETWPGLWHFARGMLFLAVVMHVVSAMAFMFSSMDMKPATATIATLSALFMDVVLRTIPFFSDYETYFITHHTGAWVRTFPQSPDWQSVFASVAYMLALSGAFFCIGAWRFCRRDFKS